MNFQLTFSFKTRIFILALWWKINVTSQCPLSSLHSGSSPVHFLSNCQQMETQAKKNHTLQLPPAHFLGWQWHDDIALSSAHWLGLSSYTVVYLYPDTFQSTQEGLFLHVAYSSFCCWWQLSHISHPGLLLDGQR